MIFPCGGFHSHSGTQKWMVFMETPMFIHYFFKVFPCVFMVRLCDGFHGFSMVITGFSVIFWQVVGTMPSLESWTNLSNLTQTEQRGVP